MSRLSTSVDASVVDMTMDSFVNDIGGESASLHMDFDEPRTVNAEPSTETGSGAASQDQTRVQAELDPADHQLESLITAFLKDSDEAGDVAMATPPHVPESELATYHSTSEKGKGKAIAAEDNLVSSANNQLRRESHREHRVFDAAVIDRILTDATDVDTPETSARGAARGFAVDLTRTRKASQYDLQELVRDMVRKELYEAMQLTTGVIPDRRRARTPAGVRRLRGGRLEPDDRSRSPVMRETSKNTDRRADRKRDEPRSRPVDHEMTNTDSFMARSEPRQPSAESHQHSSKTERRRDMDKDRRDKSTSEGGDKMSFIEG